ncbi:MULTISPECIES: hypothetical protein [unclassified Caballeronia]|uniref:hypothetical protein n=1 Tax=unclassified Caballeronia TaxID=2646786 RepID=UPI002855D0A5|nr:MULTISPECIES: hypothetical protein [unclassified Caballeronia]MDR5751141.1 hypothetical protein [Caballeronia sp. LZ024]MDR5844722.1 hypothetical protein [Caballeronia sp. LZ031]
MSRKTLTAKVAAPAVMAAAWERFPTRSDFGLEPIKFPAFQMPKLGNAAGVSRSWANEKVRAARIVKHAVVVTHNGETQTFKSVADAFRSLRLEFSKHIRFRLALKSSGKETFEQGGKMYSFSLVTGVSA